MQVTNVIDTQYVKSVGSRMNSRTCFTKFYCQINYVANIILGFIRIINSTNFFSLSCNMNMPNTTSDKYLGTPENADISKKRASIVISSFMPCKGKMELVSGQVCGQWNKNYRNGERGSNGPPPPPQPTDQPKSPTFVGLRVGFQFRSAVISGIYGFFAKYAR